MLGALLLGKPLVPAPEGRESAHVREPLADGPAPVEVGEQQRHLGERRPGDLGERQACRAHDVVGARSPPGLVDAFEHARDVIDDQIGIRAGEDVQTDGVLAVIGVDDARPVLAAFGEPLEDRLDEVPLGVDDDGRTPRRGVLEDEVRKQGRLAGAGLADHVEVVPGILYGDRDWAAWARDRKEGTANDRSGRPAIRSSSSGWGLHLLSWVGSSPSSDRRWPNRLRYVGIGAAYGRRPVFSSRPRSLTLRTSSRLRLA